MKKNLILLHGALGSEILFDPLKEHLSNYEIYSLNFSGHGGKPFSEEGFGIEIFASELEAYILKHKLEGCSVFGYSMGGYVALHLATKTSGLINQIVTLGTKFSWTPESGAKETSKMNPELMEEKIPAYTQVLSERHGKEWKALIYQTAGMMIELGETPLLNEETLSAIDIPVSIMRGDQDHMVSEEESKQAAIYLPKGQYLELIDIPHPIEKVNVSLLSIELKNHL